MGKFAVLAPRSMADDEPALRAHVQHMARAQGITVDEAAALTVRAMTEAPAMAPDGEQPLSVLHVEVEL